MKLETFERAFLLPVRRSKVRVQFYDTTEQAGNATTLSTIATNRIISTNRITHAHLTS